MSRPKRDRRWTRRDLLTAGAIAATTVGGWYWFLRATAPLQPYPLQSNGLRVSGEGRNDASRVLDPERFANPRVHEAYAIAHRIPATLNRLYCWCQCERTLGMRSLLECFESDHASTCGVCLGEAELAWRLVQAGTTDHPGAIQAAIDRWAGGTYARRAEITRGE